MTLFPLALSVLAASASATAAPACPGKTFDAFLNAFSENASLQRSYIADPLVSGQIDPEAEPEPRMVKQRLAKGAVKFPVMPGKAQRQRDRLTVTRTAKAGGAIEVLLARPDTGYQLRYLFRPAGPCWKLAEIIDESL